MNLSFETSGMSSSASNYDSLEAIIFEHGLRIVDVHASPDVDLLLYVLNDGRVLRSKLSKSPRLTRAVEERSISDYELIAGGVGVHWPSVDEDISLKGLLKAELVAAV